MSVKEQQIELEPGTADFAGESGPTTHSESDRLANEVKRVRLQLQELQHENNRLKFLLNSHPDYLSFLDHDRCLSFVNESYANVLELQNCSSDLSYLPAVIGKRSYELISEKIERALNGEALTFEVQLSLKKAALQDLRISYVPQLQEGEVLGLGARIENITLEKRAEEALKHQASHDLLTGLANRTLFFDRLSHAIHKAERTAMGVVVCFVDLNGFKAINDEFGHHVGDRLLVDVARLLESSVRSYDSVCRYGGDEFTLILEDFNRDAIPQFALGLSERLENLNFEAVPLASAAQEALPSIGMSMGFGVYAQHPADGQLLVQQADKAMYAAKKARETFRIYDPDQIL